MILLGELSLWVAFLMAAWATTVSSLNDTIDSKGKNTPSATPEFSSS